MAGAKSLFEDALKAEGVTGALADLARSIHMQESGGGKNTKTSNAGARGGMQIIPSTFKSVADKDWDINDPFQNARAGIRYVGQMFKQAGGDPALAAAGYYGGPGGLEKARRGIAVADPRNPKAPTTLEYGNQVAARMGKPTALARSPSPVNAPAIPVARQGQELPAPANIPSQVPLPVAVANVPAEAAAPIPVAVPPEAVAAAADFSGVNPWTAFNQELQRRRDVAPGDLEFAKKEAAAAAPIMNVAVPDFMQMVSGRVNAAGKVPDFQAFGSWGHA